MPTTLAIFEPTYAFIDARLGEILGGRVGDVMDQVRGPLRAALVLYVVLYGVAILRGAIAEPVIDFAIRGISSPSSSQSPPRRPTAITSRRPSSKSCHEAWPGR